MKTSDLVSVIIPCYNQAQYLEEAVHSVLDQTYQNFEIIIVNDGSTDNTEDIAQGLRAKYPRKIRVISQKNSGVSEARNNAIRQSNGQYILPLDGDDKLEQTMIEKCIILMMESNSDIIYTQFRCFGISKFTNLRKPFSENTILYENLPSNTSMYRKNVWSTIHGYKTNMKQGYEDWEFWINAYKHKFNFTFLPEILLAYRLQHVSRDTIAYKEYHDLLISQITINHPELYPKFIIKRAIETIKNIENTANMYFYSPEKMPVYLEAHLTEIANYCLKHSLKESQVITINGNKTGLCSLEFYESIESIQKLLKEMDVQSILFYAPLRYEVANLKQSEFAWTEGKGIEPAEGNFFPFVPKSIRENPDTQLIAYQKLAEYQEKQIKALDKKVSLIENSIEQQKETIRLQHKTIEEKTSLLQNSYQEIATQKPVITSIQNVINLSVIKHPVLKYKAYKSMINTYYSLQQVKHDN